ncbi:MAG: hypothetical protein JSV30_02205 [Candidatus Omnitrophota bacterium]|nr:MAG: hypothetical protein JSV30_02205 [Candidatus Omnitrophota bacterium]
MEETTCRFRPIVIALSLLLTFVISFSLSADDSLVPTIPCDFVGYEAKPGSLLVGDKVSVKDVQGNALAECLVEVDGRFGFLTVSPPDQEDRAVSFYINGVEQENTGTWQEGKSVRVDLGAPKTPLSVEIISPEAESVVNETTFSIDIQGYVNNKQALVEVTVNQKKTFTPQVNPDGTFLINDVSLLGGSNIIQAKAEDPARNTASSQIGLYQGWVLHIDLPEYYAEELLPEPYNFASSGAASAQMIIDLMRPEDDTPSQLEIYEYGHPYNEISIDEMDPRALDYALGHFDYYDPADPAGEGHPSYGYNFGVEAYENDQFNEYLRDITHWIAYPVTKRHWWNYRDETDLVAEPYTPAAVPAYGTYEHWLVINGAACDINPYPFEPHSRYHRLSDLSKFTVYGLWLTDPKGEGIGQDVYVTATECQSTMLLPLESPDDYNGKYLQVAEPPEQESQAKAEIAPEEVTTSGLNLLKIAQEIENKQGDYINHLLDPARVVNLDGEVLLPSLDTNLIYLFKPDTSIQDTSQKISWRTVLTPQALTDPDFRQAIEGSYLCQVFKVEREDIQSSYYIIPFVKQTKGQFLASAALIIDVQTGVLKQASWVDEPVRFVPITKEEAQKLALNYARENLRQHRLKITSSELIWQPQGLSNSPFSPYWKVSIGKHTLYVTQEGGISTGND